MADSREERKTILTRESEAKLSAVSDGPADRPRAFSDPSPSSLFEQWPDLGFLGMGVWWGWIWLCYNGTGLFSWGGDESTAYVLRMYLLSTVAITCAMIVAAAKWRVFTRLVDSRAFVMAFGLFASLATLGTAVSVLLGIKAFFVVFCIATGMFTSALCLKTGRLYGGIALGESLTNGALSLILACALYYVGQGIPEQWCPVFISVLPLASAALFCLVPSESFPGCALDEGSDRGATQKERHMFFRLVVASVLAAFTAGVGKGLASFAGTPASFSLEGSISVFFIGVIAVAIIVLVNSGSVHQGARIAYTTLMVLGVAVMLASGFGLSATYLSIGKEALWCVLSCLMAYLAFRFEMSPVRVFGFGQAAYFLSSALGWAVGAAVYPSVQDPMFRIMLGVILAFLVVVVMSYVFPEKSIKQIATWRVENARSLAMRDTRRTSACSADPCVGCAWGNGVKEGFSSEASKASGEACDTKEDSLSGASGPSAHLEGTPDSAVAERPLRPGVQFAEIPEGVSRAADERYGLSQRELEIMELFAQGRSANWIADSLVISKNTVRAHLRAIYSKLDVHTRQELLDFLAGN